MKIRHALEDEWLALSELAFRSKAHWGYDAAFMEDCRDELTLAARQIATFPTFVAEPAGVVAGFYMLVPLKGAYAGRAELNHFWVAPEAMGSGVGRALWTHAVGLATEGGIGVIEVLSDPNAAGFYRNMGCTDAGTGPSDSISDWDLAVLEYATGPK